jgi:hypothetical protein
MRINLAILIALIIALTAFSSIVMAGDPLKKDQEFLNSDPDGDSITTWEEFIVGTDPFNTDSDNDGLPDWWELEYSKWRNTDPNALMDPTDSSDAHHDFDYDPVSNGTGFNVGERDASFEAVKKAMDYWPANPDVTTTQPVFLEEGPHYDNYEEFYRPYTYIDPETSTQSVRYMHTNPTKPDTDGDGILDPDDYEPLGWANDGVSPGGFDVENENKKTGTNDNIYHPDENLELAKEPYYGTSEHYDFEIKIETTTSEPPQNNNKNEELPDIDNDGI